jgi:carboxymethylenebutenolidase
MREFQADGRTISAYLAVPEHGSGPGVLVLHAWWGLTDFFKQVCDRLAREGFIALAPDLYGGKTASSIEEAERLSESLNQEDTKATIIEAVEYLRSHPAVRSKGLGGIGFSMGGAYALLLSSLRPQDIAVVVIFYGSYSVDFVAARAKYLGHFAEDDEWEPTEGVHQVEAEMRAAGREVTFFTYPGTQHWFFETNRPEYDAEAATLAWQRTLDFLHERLD